MNNYNVVQFFFMRTRYSPIQNISKHRNDLNINPFQFSKYQTIEALKMPRITFTDIIY
jgi:hypothetical protein